MEKKFVDIPEAVVQMLVKMNAVIKEHEVQLKEAFAVNPMVESMFQDLTCSSSKVLSLTHHDKLQILHHSPVDSPASSAGDVSSRKSNIGPVREKRGGSRRRSPSCFTKIVTTRTLEDGQTWRKYGQKDIQSAKKPRSYFRCTHKSDQGCNARRQVQESEDDNSTYVITYFGKHTCKDPSKLPHNLLINYNDNHNSCLISFENNAQNIIKPYCTDEGSNLTTSSSLALTAANNQQEVGATLGAMNDNGDVTSGFDHIGDDNLGILDNLSTYNDQLDNEFLYFLSELS